MKEYMLHIQLLFILHGVYAPQNFLSRVYLPINNLIRMIFYQQLNCITSNDKVIFFPATAPGANYRRQKIALQMYSLTFTQQSLTSIEIRIFPFTSLFLSHRKPLPLWFGTHCRNMSSNRTPWQLLKSDWKLTFFTASCETFLSPSASAFLIMARYKFLSFIHSFFHTTGTTNSLFVTFCSNKTAF